LLHPVHRHTDPRRWRAAGLGPEPARGSPAPLRSPWHRAVDRGPRVGRRRTDRRVCLQRTSPPPRAVSSRRPARRRPGVRSAW